MSDPDAVSQARPNSEASDEYEVVASEPIFAGRVVRLRRDVVRMSDGATADREVVEHPGAVAVVALDADDRVVLVNQYRHPLARRLDELPAGLLDVHGELALAAAQRELVEEARLSAARWDVLVDLHTSPGFSTEAIRVFLARELTDAEHPADFVVEHEEIGMSVFRVPLDEAVSRVLAGAITNGTAVAGVLAAAVARARGWQGLRPADAPWPGRPAHVPEAAR